MLSYHYFHVALEAVYSGMKLLITWLSLHRNLTFGRGCRLQGIMGISTIYVRRVIMGTTEGTIEAYVKRGA